MERERAKWIIKVLLTNSFWIRELGPGKGSGLIGIEFIFGILGILGILGRFRWVTDPTMKMR